MNIGDKIKQRRLELGLTMKQVAERVGISESAVSRWESGDVDNMRRDRIAGLADVLNVDPSYIIFEDEVLPAEKKPLTEREQLHKIIDKMSDEKVDALLAAICLVERLSLDSKLMVAKVAYNAYEIEATRGQLENATISAPDMEFIHKALVEATKHAAERRSNYTAQIK